MIRFAGLRPFPAFALLLAAAACGRQPSVEVTLGLPVMQRPADWSPARAELGKQLFFDPRLSSDGSMSCSTCHLHEHAWTDAKALSTKVDGKLNTRNSPSLYNVGYQPYYYWDGRAATMEANVAAAWKGHMGGDPDAMAAALAKVEGYAAAFDAAYGQAPTGALLVDALCAFVRSLQAGGTRFDEYEAGQTDALSAEERAGRDLFFGKAACITCHTPPLFTDFAFHNIGLTSGEAGDPGRQAQDPTAAFGSFKTPGLRGVGASAPYFHDGSVATLEEAVRLMASAGVDGEHVDPILKARGDLKLSDAEIAQLVAFLKALAPRDVFTAPKLP